MRGRCRFGFDRVPNTERTFCPPRKLAVPRDSTTLGPGVLGRGHPTKSEGLFWRCLALPGQLEEDNCKKKRNFFFWREFYFWVENSRNAGRGGPKSPSLLFPPNRFRLIPRSPNLKRRLRAGESGAPWRCGGSCSRRDDESAGREAGPGPARLHQAWLSGGSIRPPAVPWCNGEHSGL